MTLSLRNLTLDPPTPSSRRRGKTIDDDALPNTLRSPAKMVALREQRTLEHSRSSENLKRVQESQSDVESAVVGNGSPVKAGAKSRPALARPKARRRSTLEWANATPQRRQEKLESMTEEKLVDCFFGLEVEGLEGMVCPTTPQVYGGR